VSDSTPNLIASPIYADRVTGEKFADATTMINAYLQRFMQGQGEQASAEDASSTQLDESGYAQVQRGSATIGVNVLEQQGVLMIFAPVMTIPAIGREAFYRRLLELSFVVTSDAAFAINTKQNEVVVRCLRRLSALDYEEFDDLLATVGDVADIWHQRLVREFRG
jgi:hypothetical protein